MANAKNITTNAFAPKPKKNGRYSKLKNKHKSTKDYKSQGR